MSSGILRVQSFTSRLAAPLGFVDVTVSGQNFSTTSYNKIVVFIDRSPAECYNKFRMLWIGKHHLPQRRFMKGSNHSFFVEMLIS